jgi:Domain of unknown function (DUF4440)
MQMARLQHKLRAMRQLRSLLEFRAFWMLTVWCVFAVFAGFIDIQPAVGQQVAAGSGADSVEMELLFIQEIKLWKALQSRDMAAFEAQLLPDFLEVENNIQTRDQTIANLNTCVLVSFNIHNHQTRMLSPDAAVIAYNANSEVACGASHLKGSYNATTTWVRRDGKWMVQLHTEMPVKP